MMTLMQILSDYTDSAEDREVIEQFARDYAWEGAVTDAEYAADVVVDIFLAEEGVALHPAAVEHLRAALMESANRVVEARAEPTYQWHIAPLNAESGHVLASGVALSQAAAYVAALHAASNLELPMLAGDEWAFFVSEQDCAGPADAYALEERAGQTIGMLLG